MIFLSNTSTDPYFNLASEEYLIDSFAGEDIFMLWRNAPSVIIGRNQNAYSELDTGYAEKKGIKVVRRLTGGGAVFHDLGNVNYTFITEYDGTGALNYPKFCRPVVEAIKLLGIDACVSGRNDILADGRKISGNAQCVRNGRVLHHGTLLWSADFSEMTGVLRPDPTKLQAKGIKSVRSRVANLRDLLPEGKKLTKESTALDFIGYLFGCFDGEPVGFTDEQKAAIQKLSDEKYSRWEWNFGKSGEFTARVSRRFPYGKIDVGYTSDRGIITDIHIGGDFFGVGDIDEFCKKLLELRIKPEYASVLAASEDVGKYISGAEPEDFAGLFI